VLCVLRCLLRNAHAAPPHHPSTHTTDQLQDFVAQEFENEVELAEEDRLQMERERQEVHQREREEDDVRGGGGGAAVVVAGGG
jgi:hypothetical protein